MKLKQSTIYQACILITGLCLLSNFTHAGQTSPESAELIDDLIKQITVTMAAVAEAEKRAGNELNDLHIELDIPGSQSPNLGLVLDVNDKLGFRVLSVSPGSLAETLNIAQGDLVTSVNGIETTIKGETSAYTELENTLPGDTLRIGLDKRGKLSEIETIVAGQYTPPIKIEVGSESLDEVLSEATLGSQSGASNSSTSVNAIEIHIDESSCGSVSTFFRPPATQNLYSAFIIQIDDRKVLKSRSSLKLAPGKHTLYVHEYITDPFFTRRSRAPQRPKTIEIDVAANTTYYLAAKFYNNKKTKEKNGEYWDPVVWRVRENRPCKL